MDVARMVFGFFGSVSMIAGCIYLFFKFRKVGKTAGESETISGTPELR